LAIWPLLAWLPVSERTAPTVMGLPRGVPMVAGMGEQAAVSELTAIRAARGSQDLRTSRDYVPAESASPADRLTNLLIAGRARAGCPLNYAIGSGGELAKW
jgi:hypothetical protein